MDTSGLLKTGADSHKSYSLSCPADDGRSGRTGYRGWSKLALHDRDDNDDSNDCPLGIAMYIYAL